MSNVVKKFEVSLLSNHLDFSSFHLHGEYTPNSTDIITSNPGGNDVNATEIVEVPETQEIKITYGYSRNHRPDLKQFIVDLICSGDGDIPIFFKSASGNESDSASFEKILVDFKKRIEVDSLMVADSALYTAANIQLLSEIKWLSRVPLSLAEAKRLVSGIDNSELVKSQINGYSYAVKTSSYTFVEQRWLVVESEARKKSDLRQLGKRIQKLEISAISQLKKLQREQFNCHQDAMKAAFKLSKQFKYYNLDNISVNETILCCQTENQECFYKVSATLSKNEAAINSEIQSAGRFILATNILDENILSNSEIISEYKAQQCCVRVACRFGKEGLAFLKTLYSSQTVFFLKPQRE